MNQKCEIKISSHTKEKVEFAKEYIQNKYSKMKKDQQQKIMNWNMFEEKISDLRLTEQEKEKVRMEIVHQETQMLRKKRAKISTHDFESIAVIGKGAFGEVRLCKQIKTAEIVAIKRLKKKQMVKKNQVAHIRAQRNVLVHGNPWIVNLKYSFQDELYLYLVMEFLQGGDLMTLLIKRNILSEEEAKFYIMQMILSIQSVHKMNYIHRDLKPDNILIDNKGHIKLSDFGLCKQAEIKKPDCKRHKQSEFVITKPENYLKNLHQIKRKNFKNRDRRLAYSAVGTPDYIAPEMLRQAGYSETVDWWSIGVILYEMLVGYAPFSSDTNQEIYYKIQHHQQYLVFPTEIELSDQVVDLIQRLVCQDYDRLGKNGVQEIKAHPWFKNANWKKISEQTPPFIPSLKSETDISNFDHYDEEEPWQIQSLDVPTKKDFNFIGYTFKQNDSQDERELMVTAIQKLERTQSSMFRKNTKKNLPYDNKVTSVLHTVQDHQYTSRSKQNPRESLKDGSSKQLKHCLKQQSRPLKEAVNMANAVNVKKQQSKSPQLTKKPPVSATGAAKIKTTSPNFTALINCLKQSKQAKQKQITPRSFKVEKVDLKAKPKPSMKFRDLK